MYGAHQAITVQRHVHALLSKNLSLKHIICPKCQSQFNVQETVSLNALATYNSQQHVH